ARDRKFIVAFDESKCYVLPYDLRDVKVLEIARKVGGLYYFDKCQDLVIPLIKFFSHHDGTKAFITKVGNLVLTDFLTLYDVLVVTEYYVSLMSVHKVARDRHTKGSNSSTREDERAGTFESDLQILIKFGLERFVSYANLNSENFYSTTRNKPDVNSYVDRNKSPYFRANKSSELKTYWQVCKEQHCIETMNKKMDALYSNDTWDITGLPSDRNAIEEVCLDNLFDFGLLVCKTSAIHLQQNLFLSNEPTSSDPVIDLQTNLSYSY
ncbi:hypothetical protein Tco_0548998, partial [Tanacetum coccineum]